MVTQERAKVALLFSGRIVQALVTLLTIKFMTHTLAPAELGQQYLVTSLVLWFSWVLINPVGMFINRHLHQWYEHKQLHFFVSQINRYFLMVAVFSLPVVFVVKFVFNSAGSVSILPLMGFVCGYIYLSTWFQTLTSFFNLLGLQKIFVSLNIINQILGLILALCFTHFFSAEALYWLSGLLAGQVMTLLMGLYLFRKKFPSDVSPKGYQSHLFSKETLLFCYPIAVTTLFMWFNGQGYRLILEKKISIESLGVLALGLSIATSLAGVVESIVTQYFYPIYYQSLATSVVESRKKSWVNLFKKTSAVYIPCCLLSLGVSPLVIRVLTNADVYQAHVFLAVGVFIEFFRQSSNIAYLVSHAEKKTHYSVGPYLLGAGSLLVGIFLLDDYQAITPLNITCVLLLAGFLTYFYNLIQVKRMIDITFEFKPLLKNLLFSLPLIVPFCLLDVTSSWTALFRASLASGAWCLFCIYRGLKFI
jgi:O-antigen/teichoic acid export membrane protein